LTRAERPTAEEVLAVVRGAVATVLEIDADELSRSSRFAELDVDSLALVEVAEIVEEQLAPYSPVPLRIPDADLAALQTLGEAVDYAMDRL